MEDPKEFKLNENERIIKVVYHHPEIIVPNLALCLLVLLLDFFLMYFFFLQGLWGVIVFFLVIALIGVYVFRLFFLYRTNKFVLTNQRLVDFEQRGLFQKNITAISYAKIEGVEVVVRGLFANLLKYGNLRLMLTGNSHPFELYKVAHPLNVQQIIHEHVDGKKQKIETEEKNVPVVAPSELEEKHLNRIMRIMQDIEALSVKEKEDLLCVLEDELREASRAGK